MAKLRVASLLIAIFLCSDLSFARQLPKECSAGPTYWCQNLSKAAACGAVGHCTTTVWETQDLPFEHNAVSDKIVKLFKELKDVKDLINQDYLATRVRSTCRDITVPLAASVCKENTAELEQYLHHVLVSKATAETMCRIVGVCGNEKIANALAADEKKQAVTTTPKAHLLGREKCTWGPSYWCSNITTGHECRATHHCVQRVWSQMKVPEDKDSICKICTDMVTQARDQLESNQTQEDLKSVFEGSCKLIPIKVVAKECMNLADQFVPDLVETLASQMNPQVVCSVAGLCNNAKIDELLEGYHAALEQHTQCTNCHRTVSSLRKRFDDTSYEEFLTGLLQMCRKMDSLSDSCSMLVFKYYENIIAALKHDLKPPAICHLSGQCVHIYHSHDEYNFPKEDLQATDDVPCEFCEQLIVHLRDILVANTTELEFYKVLNGLCKQTGNFKTECLHLVEQYYPVIYNYLVSDLKPQELCTLMGVCGRKQDEPIAPLLPNELTVKPIPKQMLGADDIDKKRNVATKQTNVRIMGQEAADVLPIERMFVSLPQGKSGCSFCQYFLHYCQVELSDIRTEEEIRSVVERGCAHLPASVSGQCTEFVAEYGPAIVALFVNEIDPASVCPALGLCPKMEEVRKVTINAGKSNCPLCLFAVEQLEAMLENNKTESSIRNALDNLCTHLSTKLRTECTDFVDTYSHQLIEMLIADMNAQEICVFLKLCTSDSKKVDPLGVTKQTMLDRIDMYHKNPVMRGDANKMKKTNPEYTVDVAGVIETNEIPDHTVNGRPIHKPKTACVVCQFVMKEIDDQITDKHNVDEIKMAVENVCKRMPKSVRQECRDFVDKYADLVVSLLAQELNAEEVCKELRLCDSVVVEKVKKEILDCAVCETVVMAVKKVLSNDKTDRNIVHIVEKSCNLLPAKYDDRCHTLMEIYGDSIIHLVEDLGTKGVCQKIGMCASRAGASLFMYKDKH